MRNFVYLSDARVDAFHSQIPKESLQQLTGDAGAPNRFGHALAVELHLASQGLLGGLDDRATFIRGALPFSYGVVEDYSQELAFFGAKVEGGWVFLVGPRAGMVAGVDAVTTGGRLDSASALTHRGLKSLNQLLRSEEAGDLQKGLEAFDPQLVLKLRDGMSLFPAATMPLHYLARTLHRVRTKEEFFALATPVFVSAVPEMEKKQSAGGLGGLFGKLFGR